MSAVCFEMFLTAEISENNIILNNNKKVVLSPPLFIRSKCLIFHAPLSRVVYFLMRTSPCVRVHSGVIPRNEARPHKKYHGYRSRSQAEAKQPPRGWTFHGVGGRGRRRLLACLFGSQHTSVVLDECHGYNWTHNAKSESAAPCLQMPIQQTENRQIYGTRRISFQRNYFCKKKLVFNWKSYQKDSFFD